jgi:hypothetical protein
MFNIEILYMGYLYIINAIGTDYYKIGMSNRVENRLQGLQTSSPFQLKIIKKFVCVNKRLVEKSIHAYLKNKKIRSEWFELLENDLNDCIKKVNELIYEIDKTNTDEINIVPIINDDQIIDEFPKKFCCNICNYETDIKFAFEKHLGSNKHLIKSNNLKPCSLKTLQLQHDDPSQHFKCTFCDISYTRANNLTRHKRICSENKTEELTKKYERLKESYEKDTKHLQELIDKEKQRSEKEMKYLESLININSLIETSVSALSFVTKNT